MLLSMIARRLLKRFNVKRDRPVAPAHRWTRLLLTALESRDVPTGNPAWAVGAAPGGEPRVWVYDSAGVEVSSYLAYESTFTGGVRVAIADLNADGTLDVVTGAGPGGGPRVRAFDGKTGTGFADFMAYDTTFTGGVWVAAGPVGSGQVGIATGADAGGGPHVRVFSAGGTQLQNLFAFDTTFTGGVRVALGQKSSGLVVYATPGDGLDPTVRGFDVGTGSQEFEQEAGPTGTTGGTFVTAGDLDSDGADDILTLAGGTELRAFRGADGAYMHRSQVESGTDGLGIVNWNGQRAIGVHGDGTVRAYSLESGTEAKLLGQLDDSSQWGASGSSLGGNPAGGTAGSLGAGSQKTLEATWTGAGNVTVTSKVTMGLPNYPDKYKWEYHVHNNSFNGSYVPPDGVVYFTLSAQIENDQLNQITGMGSSKGWVTQTGGGGFFGNLLWYEENGEDNANHILPGQDGDFWFTTPALPIVTGSGRVWSAGVAVETGGQALLPEQQNATLSLALASKYVPVNANKDNGAAWKPGLDFIPSKRDFEVVTPINVEDQQLIRATVTITGGLAGTLAVDNYNPGEGSLSFWTNRKKAASFGSIQIAAGKDPTTVTFYVEGTHESQSLDDTFINLVFTPTNGTEVSLSKEVTVTPVISSLAADIPTPSVSFLNRPEGEEPNGLKGLSARKPPAEAGGTPTNGIKLTAEIVNGPLTMKFLQNVVSLQNGANGSAAGFVLVGNVKKNAMIKPALKAQFPGLDFPLLDAVPGANNPFYPESSVLLNQGVRISMGDSPSSTMPTQAENEQVEIIDVKEFFRAHVVATYSDGTIYPIAYRDWTANFYATDRKADLGVTKLNPASKVETAADWHRSNDDPAKTKPPVFNGSIVVQ